MCRVHNGDDWQWGASDFRIKTCLKMPKPGFILAGITAKTRHGEQDFGEAQGKELL